MNPYGFVVIAALVLYVLLNTLNLVAVFAGPILLVCLPLYGTSSAPQGRSERSNTTSNGVFHERFKRALAEVICRVDFLQVDAEHYVHRFGRRTAPVRTPTAILAATQAPTALMSHGS